MWKAIRDAIKSDECTVRFLMIVAGLTAAAVILALLTAVTFAVAGPSAASSLLTAFRVIIGQLGGGQVLSRWRSHVPVEVAAIAGRFTAAGNWEQAGRFQSLMRPRLDNVLRYLGKKWHAWLGAAGEHHWFARTGGGRMAIGSRYTVRVTRRDDGGITLHGIPEYARSLADQATRQAIGAGTSVTAVVGEATAAALAPCLRITH
jgi:hypothetical protein